MYELDEELLQHHGVKGMKWGVIRKGLSKSAKSQNGDKPPSRLRENLSSMKREREWKKVVRNMHSMNTKDIKRITGRIQMENDLKRLSKNNDISSPKDKQDYLRRGKMSDQVLARKVTRLRAKDSLHRSVQEATKGQREFGKRVVQVAVPLALKYALTRTITPKDIFSATVNTKAYGKAVNAAVVKKAKEAKERRSQN